jgi:RNA polymerase sigma-70 factor, ECF subfamily
MKMLIATTGVARSAVPASAATGAQPFMNEVSRDRLGEFESLLPQILSRLRNLAAHWLGNREDAEDAVQDAMLSAFKHISRFGGRAKMSTWLTAIVINAVRMQLRRRRRARIVSLDWVPKEGQLPLSQLLVDPGITPDRAREESELFEIAIRLTSGLPRSQRVAVRLRQRDVFSIREAAMRLGVPEGTLKARLARGRAKLTKRFRQAITKPKPRISGLGFGRQR